ncbi:MAG: PorT family protein [Chitinophagaceae bacterium]|nr:PorT family protein [Chitinophagaceae bacterium]
MKRIFTLCIAMCTMMAGFAQTDTTDKQTPDTIRIGGMVIVRDHDGGSDTTRRGNRVFRITKRTKDRPSNISTNWWILDLGFANYSDNSVYGSPAVNAIAPGAEEDWFKLRAGKSRSVNIWIFMQRINMIKHVVNLKYGLGLELNNYHFDDKRIRFQKNPTQIDLGHSNLSKNKLAADYLTMPVMLNFNFTPNNRHNYGLSAGISAGYLYSARQKIKGDDGKDKLKSDFDLRKWKISYVGELSLGVVKLYGSIAAKSMFEKGLDLTPYTVGFRFSNW